MSFTIVDGNYLLCRAVFSGGEMFTSDRQYSGGVYKFLNSLWSVAEKGSIIVCFDSGICNWRVQQYEDYKKKEPREETDESREKDLKFAKTWELVYEALEVLGIPYVKVDNWEGDDVVLRMAQYISLSGQDVYVMSDDSDYFQMVNHGVTIFRPMKGEYVTKENFLSTAKIGKEHLSFSSEYFILFLSLVGTHNGVPGIKGIGPKTAIKIIQELESPDIASLIKWAQSGKSKKHSSILENIETLERNINLIDINRIPLTIDEVSKAYEDAKQKSRDSINNRIEFFRKLEIKTLAKWMTWKNGI